MKGYSRNASRENAYERRTHTILYSTISWSRGDEKLSEFAGYSEGKAGDRVALSL